MFSCSGYGSGLPFPTAGDLPDLGIKTLPPVSSAVAGKFFTIASLGKQEKKNCAHPKQPRKQRSFLKSKFYLFLIFWLSWVFVVLHRLSLDMANGDYSLLKCAGFSLWWHLLVEHRQALGTQASVVFVHGLVVSWHVKSSWTRDQTGVPCIGRQILIHHQGSPKIFNNISKVLFAI